jgi:hypothetical protein
MDWDVDTVEQQIRSCWYFEHQGFVFCRTEARKRGTELESYVFRLDNGPADRSIEITFSPPRADGRPAVSNVWLLKPSTHGFFNLKDYIKEYHSVDLQSNGFRYSDYSGTFEERVRAFLAFAEDLLRKYTEAILHGAEWPDVEFDWAGQK